ncbi:hypothetical protein LY76DRAFT_278878 [Colletotrichum caudatum]|nr:hypothetical protein LY76DRAFT_278878 [Colletotrichum caudatum]
MQVCAIPQDPSPHAFCYPGWRHGRPSNRQWPKTHTASKKGMPTGPKIQQAPCASQVTKQTSWEDGRGAPMSDFPNEMELDEKWQHIGGVSEQEATPLLEQDKRRPWRSSRSFLRKRPTKVRHRLHQLFHSQSSPANSCDQVSRAPSEDAGKAPTKKEKAAETAGGRGSSNGRGHYLKAARVDWCFPVPFAMVPIGIPAIPW